MPHPPTDSKLTIRLHKSLKRKDAAMLRAWKLLRSISKDSFKHGWGYPVALADAQVTLRQELGPDAYAESIKMENPDD